LIGAGANPLAVYGIVQTVTITSSVPKGFASSIAVSVAFSAVDEPSVASSTGFIGSSFRSDAAAGPMRELTVRLLGLDQISRALEALTSLE
jgi:hypothetical protein